ncbi:MAG: diguanylate cyclase [Oscillospiraceae bacterium]|nr:diguanylate cyclase [Oscillospiraceae bacterium]
MKIKTMIMVAAICFAIIPMVIYAVFASVLVSSNGEKEFHRQMTDLVTNQAQTLDIYLDTVQKQNAALAAMDEVKDVAGGRGNKDYVGNIFSRLGTDNSSINAVVLTDKNADIICGRAPSALKDDLSMITAEGVQNDVLYIGDTANKLMFIRTAVGDKYLVTFYNIDADTFLCKIPANSTFYNKGMVRVVDPRNNWISDANAGTNLVEQYTQAVVDRIATLGDGEVTDIIEFDGDSQGAIAGVEKKLAVMTRVGGENGLVVIASCPSNMANIISGSVTSGVVTAVVLLSLLSIAGAIAVAIFVTKPLVTIEETLTKIRRGDHEARITTVSNNEYGQISRAFNNLVDEIVVSEDRYRTITEMSDNIIFEWNLKTNEVFFSNNFNKKFSYRAPSDHFADSFLLKAKLHSDDSERYKADLEKLGNGEEFKGNEYRMKNIYGDFIWLLMRTATLRDKDGNPIKIVGVMVDIDRAKKSEQQLTARASFDALTELYNRETVESQIDNEIALSAARKSEMAVLFVDVDDFKHFNDQYSHATGDQVLKFVAKTVNNIVGEYGFAGRYGGDEFIACIRNAEINDPARAAQEIISKLDAGFECDSGDQLRISVSIGIALIKDDYNTRVEYLIGKADDAMYSVKKNGKSNFAFI